MHWIAGWDAFTVAIVGWIGFILGCYPGYMDEQAERQLYSIRIGGHYHESPVMTALWAAIEYLVAGPFGMLALQSGLFLAGTTAILRRVAPPRTAALAAVGVLLFPPVFATMAVIWPEALMASALVAGWGAALQPRAHWRVMGALLAGIAIACRPEAGLAAVPLVAVVVTGPWWRRAALALGLTLCLAGGAYFANRVLEAEKAGPFSPQWLISTAGDAAADPALYLQQRWRFAQQQFAGRNPVYDQFGEVEQIRLLHHRATASLWQRNMQRFVRTVAATPLFAPGLYFALALVLLTIANKSALVRALAVSALSYELGVIAWQPSSDYRNAHYLVMASCIALMARLLPTLRSGA